MLEHLLALQVVLPLMAAPLIVLVRNRDFAWLATTAVSYASLVIAVALASRVAEVAPDRQYLMYAMYCLCLAGLLGITITGDAFNLFVFLEISSLATYVLIALGAHRRALTAASQYMLMGTVGATFYVIGVGLLYLMTGTLNLADMAERLRAVGGRRPGFAR